MIERNLSFALLLFLGLPLFSRANASGAEAAASRLAVEALAGWTSHERRHADFSGALLFRPSLGHWTLLGPRFGLWDENAYVGGVATLWIMNAMGPGVAYDRGPGFWRVETFFAARAVRFGETGAWGFRIGPLKTSDIGWGVKTGITLEFSGVEP